MRGISLWSQDTGRDPVDIVHIPVEFGKASNNHCKLPGTFLPLTALPGVKGPGWNRMEDALPVFVLHSEAAHSATMNDANIHPGEMFSSLGSEQTDEQLMLAFSRGLNGAFSTLFERYRQPLFGAGDFSCRPARRIALSGHCAVSDMALRDSLQNSARTPA